MLTRCHLEVSGKTLEYCNNSVVTKLFIDVTNANAAAYPVPPKHIVSRSERRSRFGINNVHLLVEVSNVQTYTIPRLERGNKKCGTSRSTNLIKRKLSSED